MLLKNGPHGPGGCRMEMRKAKLPVLLPLLILGAIGSARAQGSMVVTGHKTDMDNASRLPAYKPGAEEYLQACLDYLVFGRKAGPAEIPKRAAVRIAYLDYAGSSIWSSPAPPTSSASPPSRARRSTAPPGPCR